MLIAAVLAVEFGCVWVYVCVCVREEGGGGSQAVEYMIAIGRAEGQRALCAVNMRIVIQEHFEFLSAGFARRALVHRIHSCVSRYRLDKRCPFLLFLPPDWLLPAVALCVH